jgi:hypothetical protein
VATRIPLERILSALDNKDRNFYKNLTPEEQKGVSLFLMLRYSSVVEGIPDLEGYYVAATNVYANTDFFSINKHPELQWLCLTAVSPGLGKQRHQWIGFKKKESADKKTAEKRKFLLANYPSYKESDIDILVNLVTDDEIKEYRKNHGDSN